MKFRMLLISCIVMLISFLILVPLVSAAHYVIGYVEDALDGTSANDKIVMLWNPLQGKQDNLTDIVGPNGNSGQDNTYMIDCEMLDNGCQVDDELSVKVINNGDDYVSGIVNVTVTGAGYDVAENLSLNSPPNVDLIYPSDNKNISLSIIKFNCSGGDLDENLANVTLYGNWTSGWHANETKSLSGENDSVIFTKNLVQGKYEYNCLVKDDYSISKFSDDNFTFTIDLTEPEISSIGINLTYSCGTASYARVNCTVQDDLTGIDSVIIEALAPEKEKNYTAQYLGNNVYYADIFLDKLGKWKFNCFANDSSNNTANLTSEYINVYSDIAALFIIQDSISFNNKNPIENQEVMVNATIGNKGCNDSENFVVGFYKDDPALAGEHIANSTISLLALSNISTNISWNAEIGPINIFVYADFNDSINEENETNNKDNKTINVNAWQEFYGNASVNKLLANSQMSNLSAWYNETNLQGNIFVSDKEADIDWINLNAIGKNTTQDDTSNDFSEIDSAFNMEDFNDSVSNLFTTDGNTPKATENFTIHKQEIEYVPIINSTDSENFITGILWDMGDDTNQEFDSGDSEDLVFVTKINKQKQGKYGIYDYEIKVPVRLREYDDTDISEVYFYYELN